MIKKRGVKVFIDDVDVTSYDLIDDLAQNDGFESRRDFFELFSQDFEGKIIHWTALSY